MHYYHIQINNRFSLFSKQGFFCLQTRLLCIANKASLRCKQGFFWNPPCNAWKTGKPVVAATLLYISCRTTVLQPAAGIWKGRRQHDSESRKPPRPPTAGTASLWNHNTPSIHNKCRNTLCSHTICLIYINFYHKNHKKQPRFLVVCGNSRNFAVSKRDTGRYQDKV